ncbi:unnamed protein product [Parascedosporium putredinis]|uniref:Uncharacterized protein n=1 Tax=Parascedosporium putredinis TaxID=1442378 RepID=A0A9P1H1S3_9PEZI|nr:unnamed protein product [Parascedosporium putredinis]CAI7993938.1 unnamed protein product [Parascedosporium putredinis]
MPEVVTGDLPLQTGEPENHVRDVTQPAPNPMPFFKWRLRTHPMQRTAEQVDRDLQIVLQQIDHRTVSGTFGWPYNDGFRCSKAELLRRRPLVSPQKERALSPERTGGRSLGGGTEPSAPGTPRVSLWGSTDTICQQILWAGIHSPNDRVGPPRLVIRNFDEIQQAEAASNGNTALTLSWAKCGECAAAKKYQTLAELLSHIQSKHVLAQGAPLRSFDDPFFCYVDPQSITTGGESLVTWKGYMAVNEFIMSMERVAAVSQELVYLVANPSNRFAEDALTPSPLPMSLATAFYHVLASYILLAKHLRLTNALVYSNSSEEAGGDAKAAADTKTLIASASKASLDALEQARSDIILLCHTRREIDGLSVRSVDLQFLVLAVMKNVQRFSVETRSTSACKEYDAQETNTGPSVDIDTMVAYKHYLSVLRFNGRNRPQKRVFLDIQNFHEELHALVHISEVQKKVSGDYLRLLEPGSFRMTSVRRVDQHREECAFWKKADQDLLDRLDQLRVLDEQAHSLRNEVKQAIEIIEEDHGKAIRVFTVVTLFFLPMSFVTSFMGMNTTDIRDMNSDQKLFWVTAVPVTALVIAIAFTYGYGGETISAWWHSYFQPRKKAPAQWSDVVTQKRG